jgi:hypothetical protein
VWRRGVRIYGDDHRFGPHSLFREPLHHELLNIDFRRRLVRDHAAFYFAERFDNYFLQFRVCFLVHRELIVGPNGFELLHKIGACNDVDSDRSHHLDGAGVDARNIRDVVVRRVLHRDPLAGPDRGF